MPEGIQKIPMEKILTFEEIITICERAAGLGIRRIKVTGGEPLARKGSPELIKQLKQIPGIQEVTLTTNGVCLQEYGQQLKDSGLDGVNVSLDSLRADIYQEITGRDCLREVMAGIERMLELGIPLKVNSVLQDDVNESEWEELVLLAQHQNMDVRFIEMMPIGYGKDYNVISNSDLLKRMKERYPDMVSDPWPHGNGPAVYYHIPGFRGSIGFISAIHGNFCDSCNRIRLTAVGMLKSCLCYEEAVDVKRILRTGTVDELDKAIWQAILGKPLKHCFDKWETITEKNQMVKIGG